MLKCGRQGTKCTIGHIFKGQIHGKSRLTWWVNFLYLSGENPAGFSVLVQFLLPWVGSRKKSGEFIFSSSCLAQTQKFRVKYRSLGVILI